MRSHRVYVGTVGEGLWRSQDGGATFRRASDGLFVECHVRALCVQPREPDTLYLGSEDGLFVSTDGADSWRQVDSPVNGQAVWSILTLPGDPSVLLVGTCPAGLFRSGDGGRSWESPAVAMRRECPRIRHTRVTALAADPAEPAAVWAGVEIDGVYHSPDAGRTWRPVAGRGLSSPDIHALAVLPASGGGRVVVATTNNDLNLSGDEGETWQPAGVGQALPWPYCRGLAQLPGRPEVLLLGNGDGPPGSEGVVARSTDGGRSWRAAEMPGRANSTVWVFAVHAADPDLAYAASVSGELYRSGDGGARWEKLPREFGEIRALAWVP